MRRFTSHLLLAATVIAAMTTLTSCGAWYGTTTVGPDLYVGDYPGSYYNNYYPNGYYNPGYVYPGYAPSTPPPPPPVNRPVILPDNKPVGNPGQLNGPTGPSSRPNQGGSNSGVGSPSQGGYRGQGGGGQNSRH